MTAAMVLRWLVMREARARGLDQPAEPTEEPQRAEEKRRAEPARPGQKKTRR